MDHHQHCDHAYCTSNANKSVCQTLSEMDWERGLWNAAFNGELDRVNSLIAKAKNPREAVNAPDNAGYTPLHYAARKGHVDICKVLLSNGALIDALTNSGKATPLHKAAAAGKTATLNFLIKSGANSSMQDIDGKTILHKAVENKQKEAVDFIIQAGPELKNVKDCKGCIPMVD